MADLPVGTTFGGFRIDGVLREDELGAVYRATQMGLDRTVALKVIAPHLAGDPTARERFTREARLAAANDAPGAALVHEAGEHDGRLYLAMSLLEPQVTALSPVRQPPTEQAGAPPTQPAAPPPPPAPPTQPAAPPTQPATPAPPVPVPASVAPAPPLLTNVAPATPSAPTPVAPATPAAPTPVVPQPVVAAPAPVARPRRVWPALLFALLVVGAAAAAVVVLGGDDKEGGGGGQEVSFNDPAATADAGKADGKQEDAPPSKPETTGPARVTDSIKVGDMPDGLSVGDGAVWVTNKGDGNLVRINPDTRKVTETVYAGAGPDSVLADGGEVFVTTQDDGGYLQRFQASPRLKKAGDGTFLGTDPESLALDGDGFWVAVSGLDQVRRVDVATGDLVGQPFAVGDAPVGVDAADGRVWVANTGSGSVTMHRKGAGSTEIPVGQNPRELVVSDGFVWVVLTDEDAVVRLDASTGGRVGPPIAVGDNPHKIAAGFGSLWVTNTRDSTVSQIDARSHKVVKTLPVDATPLGIAAGLGAVWVGARDAGTVVRIEP